MRRTRVLRTAAALLGVAFALGPALARQGVAADGGAPTIYKWVDENGIAHYTTNKKRVPRNLRNRIRSVEEVKREREEAALAAASAPPAAPVAADPVPTTDSSTGSIAGVESEEVIDPAFREGPLGSDAAPTAEPPAPAAVAATPIVPAAPPPTPPAAPPPPLGGPPVGTDIYAVRDAGDERGTTAARGPGGAVDSDDSLFEPEPSEGGSVDPNAAARRNEIDGRIAGLEAELAKDERRLKELISGARMEAGKPAPLYGVPELEELAHRFPKIQAEIAALRAERRALDASR